jgi:hypothetical protein
VALKYATSRPYAAALAAILVAVFYTDLSSYNYANDLLFSLAPRYVMLALGVLYLPILWKQVKQREVRFDDKLPLFAMVSAFVLSLGFVIHLGTESLSFFAVELSGLAFLLLCYLLFQDEVASFVARRAVLGCLVLAIAINLFEVVYPGTFSNTLGRAAGLYINPNSSAFALNAGLILTVGLLSSRMRVVLLIAVGAAVLATMSRAGILIFGAVALVLWWRGDLRVEWRRIPVLVNASLVLAFAVFFAGAYAMVPELGGALGARTDATTELAGVATGEPVEVTPETGEVVIQEEEAREARQTEREAREARQAEREARKARQAEREAREGGANTSEERKILKKYERETKLQAEKARRAEERGERRETENAAKRAEKLEERREGMRKRADLTAGAVSAYLQNPILGIGATQAWELKPHNTYLFYGLAYGLIGWAFVPALALVILSSGDRRVTVPMVLFLLLVAVFTHNLMMDRALLLPLALAAALKPQAPLEP